VTRRDANVTRRDANTKTRANDGHSNITNLTEKTSMGNQPATNLSANKKATVSLSSDQLDAIEISLLDAPVPPRPLTQNEALLKLAPTLRELIGRGHAKGSIVELLAGQGLAVTERAVARALAVPRAKHKK
jgi:hypothetical protein